MKFSDTAFPIAAISLIAWLIGFSFLVSDGEEPYRCTGRGLVIMVQKFEIRNDSQLIIGVTEDGREVAVNRNSIQGCTRVKKGQAR